MTWSTWRVPPDMTIDDGRRPGNDEVIDWVDLGQRMWDFLTGRQAAIHYRFEDMAVEVPRDTGPQAPRATWKLHGTLTITTTDRVASSGD